MDIASGNIIRLNQRMCICIYVLIASVVLVVSGDRTLDQGYDTDGVAIHDIKHLWNIYHDILPQIEFDLNKKVAQWIEDEQNNAATSNYDYSNDQLNTRQAEQGQSRFKRIGVAGLENLDIMTKTLDSRYHRLPMSANINTNKLRMLMRTVGRRRK